LQISAQALHRHLKSLVQGGQIRRQGTPPQVFYSISPTPRLQRFPSLPGSVAAVIEARFAHVSPAGDYDEGLAAFQKWTAQTRQEKAYVALAMAYLKAVEKIYGDTAVAIEATAKLAATFNPLELTQVFFADFYALPQFGKTRYGHQITLAKSGQSKKMLRSLAERTRNSLVHLIELLKIDAIAWVPHSIPRKIVFLKEYAAYLDLRMPDIKVIKSFGGGFPVAQKSLSKLSDRIANAESTIFIPDSSAKYERVLVVDDAVGSGATMHSVARKLKSQKICRHVFGFAIAGSYKGFEVIPEV
jgi:hypothetical protein